MKSTILALAITTAASLLSAHGQEAKAPVYRLLEKIDFEQNTAGSARAVFSPFLKNMKDQGIPEEAIKEISEAADRFFAKTYEDPRFVEEIAKAYQKVFSPEEIEELIHFYETPLGQKTIVTMPQIMQECAEIGMNHAQKHQADFQEELAAILKKHQPAEEQEQIEEVPEEQNKSEE